MGVSWSLNAGCIFSPVQLVFVQTKIGTRSGYKKLENYTLSWLVVLPFVKDMNNMGVSINGGTI